MKHWAGVASAVLLALVWVPSSALAFKAKVFSIGAGYYSQNFLNKTAVSETGETGLLGEPSYPLNLKFDYEFANDWFIAPQLSYTLLPRSTPGDTAKVTIAYLAFPIGKNITRKRASVWDWYIGPGLIRYEIKGAGGTTVMNNGTGSATFAIPGRTSSVQKITTHLGTSYAYERSRFGFDLIIENILSQTKRTQNFMLSYAYQFGKGF